MNREQYIKELAHHLRKLPPEERVEALRYYEEYFFDAGAANEQTVIQGLGSPKKLAAGIKADSAMRQYAESYDKNYDKNYDESEREGRRKTRNIVGVVFLCIFAAPVALPIAIALFAVVFSIFVVIGSLLVSGVAIGVSGLATLVLGIVLLFSSVPTGLFYIGGSLVLIALGLIFTIGMVSLFRVTGRGFIMAMNRLRHGGRAKEPQPASWQHRPADETPEANWQSGPANEETANDSAPDDNASYALDDQTDETPDETAELELDEITDAQENEEVR
jgi:uncharacterized membrane protein